jgi:aminoglycoside phosphotransferase (APT) family kinase protein
MGGAMDDQTLITDADLATVRHVLTAFVPNSGAASIQPIRGGLSGSAVFVCEVGDNKFAMKRWPSGTTAQRVDDVHAVVIRARQSLPIVPELIRSSFASSRVSYEGYQYELARWMDGSAVTVTASAGDFGEFSDAGFLAEPLSNSQVSRAILAAVEAGGEAIARFHDSVRRTSGPMVPAPAVLRRLGRIERLRSDLPRAIGCADKLSPALRAAAKWLERQAPSRLDAAHHLLGQWTSRMVPTQMVLRDVHRQHILFREAVVTGLVDFDAVGLDTVATDLARWVGDFAEKPADLPVLMDAALTGYQRFAPISGCESELASAISEASSILLLGNWVVWTGLGQQNFSGYSDLVDRRVSDLMRRIGASESIAIVR